LLLAEALEVLLLAEVVEPVVLELERGWRLRPELRTQLLLALAVQHKHQQAPALQIQELTLQ
jgi:hypothetical protein